MKNILRGKLRAMLIMGSLLLGMVFTTAACSIEPGGKAADFTLQGLDGEKIVLSQMLKDKKAVLVFWATWCPPCVKEVPHVEKFHKENKEKAAVVGIDIGESRRKVEAFVRKKNISYPIALDSDNSIAELYGVRGVPTVVAVDKDGNIVYYGHSIEEMKEKVDF